MSPTQALFWKEWRQIQWRWLLCLVICCLFVFIGLKTRVLQDDAIIIFSFLIGAFLVPLFIAMGLVAEEREQGCMKMQLALPVAASRVYIIKMTLGALAAAVPTMAVLIITLIMAGNREKTMADILRTYGFAVPFGIVYMLWTVVFSMKRKTQWAAALTGIAIAAAWMFLVIFDDTLIGRVGQDNISISLVITPLGFIDAGPDKGQWLAASIVQTVLTAILFWWGMRRFSTLARSGK